MKVYIAGKIIGLPEDVLLQKFYSSENLLKKDGHTVISPVTLKLGKGFEYKDYIHIWYAIIDVCDAVYLQKDWRDSEDAKKEREYAIDHKKQILYEDESTRDDTLTKKTKRRCVF